MNTWRVKVQAHHPQARSVAHQAAVVFRARLLAHRQVVLVQVVHHRRFQAVARAVRLVVAVQAHLLVQVAALFHLQVVRLAAVHSQVVVVLSHHHPQANQSAHHPVVHH